MNRVVGARHAVPLLAYVPDVIVSISMFHRIKWPETNGGGSRLSKEAGCGE